MISCHTSLFWKKLLPEVEARELPEHLPEALGGGLSKPYSSLISSMRFGSTPWSPR